MLSIHEQLELDRVQREIDYLISRNNIAIEPLVKRRDELINKRNNYNER